jgi:hypothetical protein
LKSLIALLISGLMTFPVPQVVKPAFAEPLSEQQQIQTLVVQTLTTPGLPADANPKVTQVAISDQFAIAGWLLGEGGGEMLLIKQQGKWQVVTGGGGAMNVKFLVEKGVPAQTASQLIQRYQAHWQQRGH